MTAQRALLALLAPLALAATAPAQVVPQTRLPEVFRVRVRHADPWLIKAMLEGQGPDSPELSKNPFAAMRPSVTGRPLLQTFVIVVDPTDNSLLFIPRGR